MCSQHSRTGYDGLVNKPDTRTVLVHRQGGSSARLGANDQLNGEDVLPGFTQRAIALVL